MYSYAANLRRVIDGDTVVLDLDLGFRLWRENESYRLARIDAPELRDEPAGPAARDALAAHLGAAASLMVQTSRADKYGRWLVELYADGRNVNDWLVASGLASYRTY